MRQNSAQVILPLDEQGWLKWLHDKFGLHDLLSRNEHGQDWIGLDQD